MTALTAVIVLQARAGSSRLPGKVLRELEGQSILARCLDRLAAQGIMPVVVATTWRTEDDVVVREATARGVEALRGATADVLGRFAMVAERFAPEFIIRATADNPAVDLDASVRVLALLQARGADYVVERNLPIGGAVEGMRTAALLDAAQRAGEPYDREHVTPFLRRAENGYRVLQPDAPMHVSRPDLRFTVDTPEDFAYMARVIAEAGGAARLPLADLIRAADRIAGLQEVA